MTAKKIALFIDADNISPKYGKQIIDALESRGEIFIRRIYGNWEKILLRGWNDSILNFSLRAVQQPDFVTGKNATDMSLTIDAMDVLHEGKAEIFALVSNDSDFTPLVIRLREGGMTIIGLGSATVSNAFRVACTEFIDLDAPPEVKAVQPALKVESAAQEKKIPPAPERKIPVQLSLFGDEKIVALTPKTESPKMIQPAQKSSAVLASPKIVPIDKRQEQSERDKKIQQIHNTLHEAAKIYANDEGFADLCYVGSYVMRKNLGFGVKDLGYGKLQKFLDAFPDRYEVRKSEYKAFLRCRKK